MPAKKAVFAAFLLAFAAAACGGGDPGWIGNGSGGAQDRSMAGKSADAGPEGGGYRDPNAGDGGCASPNQVCASGMTSACIDVSSDHENCGACGKACLASGPAGDSMCVAGNCSCTDALRDYCDGIGCLDVSSDVNNCGSCGYVCDPNQFNACVLGNCLLQDE